MAAVRRLREAIAADERGEFDEAVGLYRSTIDLLRAEGSPTGKVAAKIDELERRIAVLTRGTTTSIAPQGKVGVYWDDVIGLDEAKSSLNEALLYPIKFPSLMKSHNIEPWSGILLYGPPGTGKTQLARAAATELDATFFSVASSDIISKWVGESEKNIKALFDQARASRPAIIFIDEIDSLCVTRQSTNTDASNRVLTTILTEMDGIRSNENTGVLIIGATNMREQLDDAALRRFDRQIYVGLPDAAARKQMLRKFLPNSLSAATIDALAAESANRSGSDIAALAREIKMRPLRNLQLTTHFRPVGSKWTPCAATEEGAQERRIHELDHDSLQVPPIDDAAAISVAREFFAKM